jgi:hypothetical protein
LVPERVYWEDERVDWKGNDVDYHPSDMLPLPLQNEDERLQTVDGRYHDNRDDWELAFMGRNQVDKVTKIDTRRWKDDRTEKIDENDESHTETTETAHLLNPYQFCQVVYGRIDPSSSLRKQNAPGFGGSGTCIRIGDELIRHVWEMFGHKGCKVTIFTKGQEVLLV